MSLKDPYEGQKFTSFDVLKKYLEEYGQRNFVKFWIRSSHTINSLKSKNAKKMNPELKYVCMKFACIFGGEKIRCRGSGIRKSTTYRNLGCPCMINAVVGEDGNHVRLETVVLEHNHALCKSLYDSIKKSKNKIPMSQSDAKVNQDSLLKKSSISENAHSQDRELVVIDGSSTSGNDSDSKCEKNTTADNDAKNIGMVPIEAVENFQDYLKAIQQKYGNNIKILVVRRDEPEPEVMVKKRKVDGNGDGDDAEADDDDGGGDDDHPPGKVKHEPEHKVSKFGKAGDNFECYGRSRDKEICRLCLSTSNKLTPIFKQSSPLESTILSFKIMSCASIEVSNGDELPSNICSTCEETLDIAYNFRIRCENSDSMLRKTYLTSRFLDAGNISEDHDYSKEFGNESRSEELFKQRATSGQEKTTNYYDVGGKEKESAFQLNGDFSNGPKSELYRLDETCPICGGVFYTYAQMLEHMKEHNDLEDLLLACNLCGAIFTTVKSLLQHMDEHIIDIKKEGTDQMIDCSQCELSFLTAEDRVLHEGTHATKTEELFDSENQMGTSNHSTNGYLCNVCGKILKSKDRFQSHRNMHEGLRPHICLKCGRGFADRKNMHQHYDIVHLRKAKHECPICHKKFYAPTKMKSHITMHYGVKPFSCDVCSKTFRLRMNMIKHKKTHSNERPHKCDKCNAAFIDKNLLTRHSYVHGGVRPYVCQFCGHRFTVKFNLKKHMVSGRCSGRNKITEVGSEYDVNEWVRLSDPSSQSRNNLPEGECIEEQETKETNNFSTG